MDELVQAFSLVFTPGSELSQIVLLTLQMSVLSTGISTVIGVPLGVCVGLYRFRGKRLVMRILNTLMGLPPVLAGLIVFFILSRSGPLGSLRLLYTLPAMVTAQVFFRPVTFSRLRKDFSESVFTSPEARNSPAETPFPGS